MWNTEPYRGLPSVDELLRIAEEVDPVQFELDKQHRDWERALKYKEDTLNILFARYFRVVTIPVLQNRVTGLHPAQTLLVALEICESPRSGQLEKLNRNEKRLKVLGVDKAVALFEAGWLREDMFRLNLWDLRNCAEFVTSIRGELADNNYRWKDIYEQECIKSDGASTISSDKRS